jgi:hypothetical protein
MRRTITATAMGALLITALTGCAVTTDTTAVVDTAADVAAPKAAAPIEQLTPEIPKARTGAPALRNTGLNWQPILQALTAYGQWILANPNPDKVTDIAAPGCAYAQLTARQVTGLLGSNAYLQPSKPTFLSVTGPTEETTEQEPSGENETTEEIVATPIGNNVTLTVTVNRAAEPVVNTSGKEITSFPALQQAQLHITLVRDADNKWRFCTVTPVNGRSDKPVSLL